MRIEHCCAAEWGKHLKEWLHYPWNQRNASVTRFTTKWETVVSMQDSTYDVRDKFTCCALLSIECPLTVNGTQCHSNISTDVDIEVKIDIEPSIASDVGNNVYIGEKMSTTCISNYYYRADGYFCYHSHHQYRWKIPSVITTFVSNAIYRVSTCTFGLT